MWHRNKRAKGPHKGSILKVSATNHFATTVSIGAGKRAGDASGWTQDPGPKRAIASGRPPRRMCANAMHEPFHDDKNAVSRFGQSAKRQRGNGDGDPRSRRSEFMRKDRHGIPEDKNTHIVDRTRLGIYMKRKEGSRGLKRENGLEQEKVLVTYCRLSCASESLLSVRSDSDRDRRRLPKPRCGRSLAATAVVHGHCKLRMRSQKNCKPHPVKVEVAH
jgi:hypothetical protein